MELCSFLVSLDILYFPFSFTLTGSNGLAFKELQESKISFRKTEHGVQLSGKPKRIKRRMDKRLAILQELDGNEKYE